MTTAAYNDVVSTAEKLTARADFAGINSLTSSEQIIVQAWSAFGIICNGGFHYFYEGSADILAVADAFETLGLSDAAQACHESMTLFSAITNNGGYEQRRERMAQIGEADLDSFFDPLNYIIWELDNDDKLVHAIAAYMRQIEQQT